MPLSYHRAPTRAPLGGDALPLGNAILRDLDAAAIESS